MKAKPSNLKSKQWRRILRRKTREEFEELLYCVFAELAFQAEVDNYIKRWENGEIECPVLTEQMEKSKARFMARLRYFIAEGVFQQPAAR